MADTKLNALLFTPGSVVQRVHTLDSAAYAAAGTIPNDNTKPTWAEGAELTGLATTFTPISASNYLLVQVMCRMTVNGSNTYTRCISVFRDPSGSDECIAAQFVCGYIHYHETAVATAKILAGTTSPITFKVRSGGSAGGTWVNSLASASGQVFGGTANSTLTILELSS